MNTQNAIRNAALTMLAVVEGRYLEAAGYAADLVLDLLPAGDARQVLDAAIFRRAQAEGAALEQLKFGDLK